MFCKTLYITAIIFIWLISIWPQASFSEIMTKENNNMTVNKIDVMLTIQIKNNSAVATLYFKNSSNNTICIDKINGCLTGSIKNNVFSINYDDTRIPYTGKYYKRRAPGPNDVVKLPPAQSISTVVILNEAYRFLPGRHTYTVSYDAFHQFQLPGFPGLLELKSNKVTFDYKGK